MLDKLIYSVYFILPVVLLWGAKYAGKGKWNDSLALDQSKAFQGFLAVCIMLHHVGQKTCASWLTPKTRIQQGLGFFVPMGFLFVSVFLFFNGYGVYKSFHSKDNYLKGFVKKRILPLVFMLYSTTIIFYIARLIIGQKMDLKQTVLYLTSIQLCNPNTWYVIVLPFFYLAFYFAFKFIKNDGVAVLVTCAFVVAYMLFGTTINHNNYWIRGEWWYNCVHLFAVGIIFAKFEDKIIAFFKRFYAVLMPLSVLAVYPLYLFSRLVCNTYSYYGENWGAPDTVFRRRMCLGSEALVCVDFVLMFILLGMKIKIGNRFLKFMSKITLEFYLIHGLFVELFAFNFDGGVVSPLRIHNLMLYSVLVFVLGVPSALFLKKISPDFSGKKKLAGNCDSNMKKAS
ncbi:MAG: acyltransferase family protein [Butyrivibrio sp.]|nr:acyltransferase family protein [Butyrivibrio sp.]